MKGMVPRTIASLAIIVFAFSNSWGQSTFAVGDDEDDGTLFYPRQVEEGPDGNIYVFDSGDSFIKVFTAAGEYVRRIGGEGEGPGKFQRADGAAFGFLTDGDLYFTEFIGGHRWITVMELSGDLKGVLSLQMDEAFGVRRAHALTDGGYLVHLTLSSTPKKVSDYYLYSDPQALVRIDSQGQTISKIIAKEYTTMISMVPDGATSQLPYHPIFAWVPLEDGTVVFTDGMSRSLKVLDQRGQLVREIAAELPGPEKVTKEDLDAWRKEREEWMMARNPSWHTRFGKVIYKYEKSLYDRPLIAGMSLTPKGQILVAGARESGRHERTYWLLDGEGKITAKVALDCWALNISESFLFYMTADEDGNTVVNCSKRAGEEHTDLLMMRSP